MSKKKIGIIVAVIFVALIGVVGGTQTPDTQTDIKKTTTSISTELRVDDRVVVPLESEGKESDTDTVNVQGYTSEITTEEIEKTTVELDYVIEIQTKETTSTGAGASTNTEVGKIKVYTKSAKQTKSTF